VFEIAERIIETDALDLRYHRAPWDEATVGAPVAVISRLDIRDDRLAREDFGEFTRWVMQDRIVLASCRLPHDSLRESGLLEASGFRFIELNFRPELVALQEGDWPGGEGIEIEEAVAGDQLEISTVARKIFDAGRFHRDPMIDRRIGDRRYERWITNAFGNPRQTIVKCLEAGHLIGFFVVEAPDARSRFWSLVGLAPGLAGRGLGTRVWIAMLNWHRAQGVHSVSTSISSLNTAVHNLYVKLGFRFPTPHMTFHWCPLGPIRAPE
jgi:GNAT superfamily N-acetyltransferase